MSKNKIRIHRDELGQILTVLDKFPDVRNIDIEVDNSSGIGYTTSIEFEHVVNDVSATVKIMITDVDQW
jgi:hypothetical protein